MNILVIGDPHYQVNNRNDTDLLEKEIIRCVNTYTPDLIVFLGDILDNFELSYSNPMTRVSNFLGILQDIFTKQLIERNIFKENTKYIYILIGNHDIPNNKCFLTGEHHFNLLKKSSFIEIIDYPVMKIFNDNIQIVFTPFIPVGRFIEALDIVPEWKSADIVFAHQEINGVVMKYHKSDCLDVWEDFYPRLISGHIHGTQELAWNVFYPGTPYQTNFGEEDHAKGLLLVKITDTDIEYQRIVIRYIKKRTIIINFNEIETFELSEIFGISPEDFNITEFMKEFMIKLEIHCTTEQLPCVVKYPKISMLERYGIKITKVSHQEDIQTIHIIEELKNGSIVYSSKRIDFIEGLRDVCSRRGQHVLDIHNEIIKKCKM